MNYVVDASFVIAFLMPDEASLDVDVYFNQYKSGLTNLISSPLLPFEVANGLQVAVARKRITLDYSKKRLQEFLNYRIEIKKVDFMKVFIMAQKQNLTCYDASYLYLSKKEKLPLLTLDEKLKNC